MAIPVHYPGVYIEEFTPGAPIQGVSTSIPVFLGPSSGSVLPNEPTRITSWDQFRRTFGNDPLQGFYLWYAVRGFFENGGQSCYVVRVSNASRGQLVLNDQSTAPGQPTLVLAARDLGPESSQIKVSIDGDVHAVNTEFYRPTATIKHGSNSTLTVSIADEAAQFRPGDRVTWTGTTESQPSTVVRVTGSEILLSTPLAGSYSNVTLRLADLASGDKVLRVQDGAELSSGSVIQLKQDSTEVIAIVERVEAERIDQAQTTYRVTLREGLAQPFKLDSEVKVNSQEFSVIVTLNNKTSSYPNLAMDPAHDRYFARVINQDEKGWITASEAMPPSTTPAPNNRPKSIATAVQLSAGLSDRPEELAAPDYIQALASTEPIRDISMVAVPDRNDSQVQKAVLEHCERLYNRFAILDARRGAPLFNTGESAESQRKGLDSAKGFAAFYWPWLLVPPAVGDEPLLVPPSGHIAGIYARTDTARGVHKAPAGNEATVNGALGVERSVSDRDQGIVNMHGINVIRVFSPGGRPLVWGARTTATDTNWQYINIRRLFIYLERSIEEGIRWAVFEPNNLSLWQKLKRTLREFLTKAWRDGALFGANADEAFYVRIDEGINPFSEQALGRLNIEIGVRPSYPAEFIIVRIGIWPGGAETTEA